MDRGENHENPRACTQTQLQDWGINMTVIQVGLTDRTREIDPRLVQEAAAALNIQVLDDLAQYWDVKATVRYLPDPMVIPAEVWPVYLVGELPEKLWGVHLDKKQKPYALVETVSGSNDWTIEASHEIIEMLVDPSGNRLRTSFAIEITPDKKIRDTSGQFNYLVEACDPCQGSRYAYSVQGIAVSDFITPHFYDPELTSGTRYSFGDHIPEPRRVLPGGYISFVDPQIEQWQQILYPDTGLELKPLGAVNGASVRTVTDKRSRERIRGLRKDNPGLAESCKSHRTKILGETLSRGLSLDLELRAGGLGPHS
jgi:hypothetical protein